MSRSDEHYRCVAANFAAELEQLWADLGSGLSVLVEVEPDLRPHLRRWLRERAAVEGDVPVGDSELVGPREASGYTVGRHLQDVDDMAREQALVGLLAELTQRLLPRGPGGSSQRELHWQQLLEEALELCGQVTESTGRAPILLLPHLDLLAPAGRDGLDSGTLELAMLLRKTPWVAHVGFCGPTVELHPLVAELFQARRSLRFVKLAELDGLLEPDERRALYGSDHDAADPRLVEARLQLYQLVAHLTPVRLRQVLRRVEAAGAGLTPAALRSHAPCLGLPAVAFRRPVVGGYRSVRRELYEQVVAPYRAYRHEHGFPAASLPRGVLLYGPPGCGKTHVARWVCHEMAVGLEIVSGPELRSMYVGEAERKLREVFARARATAPSVIVIDEIDVVGARRNAAMNSGDRAQVTQLMVELSGVRQHDDAPVVLIGTTNIPEALEPGLVGRAGRFSVHIEVGLPTEEDLVDEPEAAPGWRAGLASVLVAQYAPYLEARFPELQRDSLAATLVEGALAGPCPLSCDHVEEILRVAQRFALSAGDGRSWEWVLDEACARVHALAEETLRPWASRRGPGKSR